MSDAPQVTRTMLSRAGAVTPKSLMLRRPRGNEKRRRQAQAEGGAKAFLALEAAMQRLGK